MATKTVADLKKYLEDIPDDVPLYNMGHSYEFPVETFEEVLGLYANGWMQTPNGKKEIFG